MIRKRLCTVAPKSEEYAALAQQKNERHDWIEYLVVLRSSRTVVVVNSLEVSSLAKPGSIVTIV